MTWALLRKRASWRYHKNNSPCENERAGCLIRTMPEGEVKLGVVDVKALAAKAGSSQRAKKRELEELLAIRDQLEKGIESGSRNGIRVLLNRTSH